MLMLEHITRDAYWLLGSKHWKEEERDCQSERLFQALLQGRPNIWLWQLILSEGRQILSGKEQISWLSFLVSVLASLLHPMVDTCIDRHHTYVKNYKTSQALVQSNPCTGMRVQMSYDLQLHRRLAGSLPFYDSAICQERMGGGNGRSDQVAQCLCWGIHHGL